GRLRTRAAALRHVSQFRPRALGQEAAIDLGAAPGRCHTNQRLRIRIDLPELNLLSFHHRVLVLETYLSDGLDSARVTGFPACAYKEISASLSIPAKGG